MLPAHRGKDRGNVQSCCSYSASNSSATGCATTPTRAWSDTS